jgi:large subunit ribosomal protein L7/L12
MSQNPIEDAYKTMAANSSEQTKSLKSIAFQNKIQTVEFLYIGKNTTEIASNTKRLVTLTEDLRRIQTGQLEEQKRTNVLLEKQLVETSLEKLERNRQVLLKQAAYAVGRDAVVAEKFKPFPKYILLQQITAEIATVNLNPDELHEISDKEYAHTALKRLQESTAKAESDLTESDTIKLQTLLRSLEAIGALPGAVEQKQSEKGAVERELTELHNVLTTTQKKEYGATRKIKKIIGKIIGVIFFLLAIICILPGFFQSKEDAQNTPLIGFLIVAAFFGILGTLFFFALGSSNKKLLGKLQKQIQELEGKVKALSAEHQDINTRLEESRRFINGIAAEYPELKKQSLAFQQPFVQATATSNATFDVILASVPADKKIAVINAVRALKAGLGLADAKAMVECAPMPVSIGVNKEDMDAIKKKLEAAGANVEIRTREKSDEAANE